VYLRKTDTKWHDLFNNAKRELAKTQAEARKDREAAKQALTLAEARLGLADTRFAQANAELGRAREILKAAQEQATRIILEAEHAAEDISERAEDTSVGWRTFYSASRPFEIKNLDVSGRLESYNMLGLFGGEVSVRPFEKVMPYMGRRSWHYSFGDDLLIGSAFLSSRLIPTMMAPSRYAAGRGFREFLEETRYNHWTCEYLDRPAMWFDRLPAEQCDAAARVAFRIASSGGDAFRRLAELLLEQDEVEEFHDLRQATNKDVVLHLANSLLARGGARVTPEELRQAAESGDEDAIEWLLTRR
jgi:hypothetical protein